MPLVGTYMPNGIFFNGTEENDDGTVTMTRELPIPFQRNRFCNPLGRLLGPGGKTVKWLRNETGCDIIVHTNDVRFLKVDSKVTIKGKADPSKIKAKMDHAVQLVLAILDQNDPGNTAMSDYQLFHPEDPENRAWIPANFNAANSGPTPPPIVAPGVVAAISRGQQTGSRSFTERERGSSSVRWPASHRSAQAMTPNALSPTFAPTSGLGFGVPSNWQSGIPHSQQYGGMHLPWYPTGMPYTHQPMLRQQRPFFHSRNLAQNYLMPW